MERGLFDGIELAKSSSYKQHWRYIINMSILIPSTFLKRVKATPEFEDLKLLDQ